MRKRPLVTLLLILGAGGSLYAWLTLTRAEAAPAVLTAPVTRGAIVSSVSATGTVQAVTTVQLGTQVSGAILELYADYNSIVRKGQVVAQLDPSLYQTQIEQARANLVRAEADLERIEVALADARTKLIRAEELWARQLLPRTERDGADVAVRSAQAQVRSAEAQVTQARASLHQSEVNLRHTVITSPIDGIVISRNVDVGQTVAASMQAPTLFVLAADLASMQVVAHLDESDVGVVAEGQRVEFTVDAWPTDRFRGSVAQVRLQPTTEQGVVTYATVIDVPNPELKLKPGMTASVTIETARRDDVVRVPNASLRFRPSAAAFAALNQPVMNEPRGRAVWVFADGLLAPVDVRTGLTDGIVTELLEGDLAPGTAVVTAVSTAETTARPAASAPPALPFAMPGGGPGTGRGLAR